MANALLDSLQSAIVDGDDVLAAGHARAALAAGVAPQDVLDGAILPAIARVSELWKANRYFLPDVVLSAEAFRAAMGPVAPLLRSRAGAGWRVVLGVVHGDVHDLGKSLVAAMLTASGFDVTDLGIDVPLEKFVEAVRTLKPEILGLGAYMTTTMLEIKTVIAALEREGLRAGVKVIVGGVPTSQAFAREAGADAWGKDALDAVVKCRGLVEA
jgi:5-methyltetrahydrofolate--homocysteine methyltransferase